MGVNWQPLSSSFQHDRWQANLEALQSRDATLAETVERYAPANEYLCAPDPNGRVQLARRSPTGIRTIVNPISPTSSREIIQKLYPGGHCTEPLMIAGMDQGWLWNAVYDLDCDTPRTPGHRPPLFFLTRQIEKLWVALHLHDWSKLLSDPRVHLFVGPDAVAQCQQSMMNNTHVPWAKLCVTIEQDLWPSGVNVDSLWQKAHQHANSRMQQLARQVEALYADSDVKSIIRKLRGERLRVLGFTSHYTTFLKYSMSDWLDAFAAMGHDTQIVMERGDHEVTNPLYFAQAILDFRPDLILMIDHYRAEITGLPRQVPCVMWVQDNLPNIFNVKAGAAQGQRDYCLGFGRLHLRDCCGYPEQRFMPAQVGVNESRFAPSKLTREDLDEYACDISFVSHASAPATALLTEQINRADAVGRKLLLDVFEQIRAVYDAGGAITHASLIDQMIDHSLQQQRVQLDQASKHSIFDFFNNRINNAMFRHQALNWAADLGVELHLWGRGWDQHPRFARFAKGVACNNSQLCKIYQCSRINLQVTPFGAVHQRLLDGLAAGGFFLIRHTAGDVVEPIYQKIYAWCCQRGIETDEQLQSKATPEIGQLLNQVQALLGVNPFELSESSMMDVLRLAHDGNYIRSAASVWPEYQDVCFNSAAELRQRVSHFLKQIDQRNETAASMRRAVINRLSYTSISRRLLDFIADDLARSQFKAKELAA